MSALCTAHTHQELGEAWTSKLPLADLIDFSSLFHIHVLSIPGSSPIGVFCLPLFFSGYTGGGNSIVSVFLTAAGLGPLPQASESCNHMKPSEYDGKLQSSFRRPVGRERDSGPKAGAVLYICFRVLRGHKALTDVIKGWF